MSTELLSFLIHWGPTLVFVFCLTIAFLFGLWRGLRKSVILLIQAAVVFGILLIIYFIVVNQPSTDPNLFDFISKIIGEGKIQQALKVSPDNKSFADCFIEFIPKQVSFNEGIALVLKDNGAYLASLADMAVRIVIALVFGIIYLLGIFLLYIIYLLFYPQRKYEKKLKDEYLKNQEKEREEISQIEDENQLLKQTKPQSNIDKESFKEEMALDEAEDKESFNTEDNEILAESSGSDTVIEGENQEEILDVDATDDEVLQTDTPDLSLEEETPQEEVSLKPVPEAKYQGPYQYKKRRLFGALVGSVRNLFSALIFFSLIGGLLFLITGGSGEGSYQDIDFEDKDINMAYDAYKEIETYGTTGIFKVLNTFKDSSNTPYYLFAADLVFQGGLHDEERGINENVYLRRELSAYTKFARETFDLVLKYGQQEIKDVIHARKNSNSNPDGNNSEMMDAIMSVLAKDEFKNEFEVLIDNFEASTYFTNLSYSLLTSFVNHIDKFGLEDSLGADPLSLIQIMFKPGYLASQIPYENKLKESNQTSTFEYIKPEMILNKENAKVLSHIVFDVAKISATNQGKLTSATAEEQEKNNMDNILTLVNTILPHIKQFTLFNDENKEAVSGVLKRVYEFSLNTYFKNFMESQGFTFTPSDPNINPYTKASYQGVDFVNEIKDTLGICTDLVTLYSNMYQADNDFLAMVFNVFDESNPNHEKAYQAFTNVKEKVSDSFLLGDLLGSSYGKQMLEGVFSAFSDTLTLPEEINYRNTKDSNGNIVHGEFYNLLNALEAFCSKTSNKDLVDKISNMGSLSQSETFELIDDLCEALETQDKNHVKAVDHILNSLVFKVVFSDVLINKDFGDFKIYVDDTLKEEKNGVKTNIISKEHLSSFFQEGRTLVNIFKDFDTLEQSELMKKVLSEGMYNALNSKIIEGTITNYLATKIDIDMVVIPKEVKNLEKPISTSSYDSETKKIIGLYQVSAFDIETLTKEYEDSKKQMQAITNMLKALTDQDYDKVLSSNILYYSMSNYVLTKANDMIENMDIIVPNTVRLNLTNDTIPQVISKSEIKQTFKGISLIMPESGEMDDILPSFRGLTDQEYDTILNSKILHFTVSNYLVNHTDAISTDITIIIPNASKEATELEDNTILSSVIKTNEIKDLIKSALIILPDDGSNVEDIMKEFRRIENNNQMDDVLASKILHYTVSNYLNTNADVISDKITLVIPYSCQETLTDEVLERVITKAEIKKALHSALIVLPESGEMDDVMKEFRRIDTAGEMDEVLASDILHFTVSNYLKNNTDAISDKITLVIPNSCQTTLTGEVVDKVITKTEIETAVHSALIVLPESGEMEDVMDEFRRIDSEGKMDEVLASDILHFTVSNYLKNNSDVISDKITLVIPNVCQNILADEVVDKVITKDELKKAVHSALVIMPENSELDDVMKEFRRIENNNQMDEVFQSSILHFTVSNYLKNNTDVISTDVALVIPNACQDTLTAEVVDKVITVTEIKNLLHSALIVIPEGGSVNDIMTEFRRIENNNQMDEVFQSEILHFTVSNYLKNNTDVISSDVTLVIPYSCQTLLTDEVVDRVITVTELKDLIHGALMIIPEAGTIDNILNILENMNSDDYDEIFTSKVLHYTFSGYLNDNKNDFLGDGGDLIIPAAACDILSGEVVERVIKKTELIMFLLDATSILPEDKNNIEVGKIMNQIIKNEDLLRGLILSASMTNMMVNSTSITDAIEDVLKIPTALKDEATLEKLDLFNYLSDWYFENKNFMKALNALIGSELDDTHTVLDSDLSDKVYDNFKNLNEGTPSKLDIAYSSLIMANTISSRIDELDVLTVEKKASIKALLEITGYSISLTDIYKKEEIASLVDLINFLDLDLKSTTIMSSALDTTKLQQFNQSPATEYSYSGTYLEYFYLHEITGLILTNGIEDALDIPLDAYVSGKLYITLAEASAFITALDTLNLDLNSFTFDSSQITIAAVRDCIFNTDHSIKSRILFQKTSDEVLSLITSLIVMASDYDSQYQRFTADALYDFFEAALVMGVTNIGDNPDVEHFKMNKTDEEFDTIVSSSVMRSTLVQYIAIEFNGSSASTVICYNDAFFIMGLDKNGSYKGQLTHDEAYNLFRSIKILSNGTGEVSNISLDLARIKALSDSEREIVLSTELIKYHVSKTILEVPAIGYETVYPTDTVAIYDIINVKTLDVTNNVKILSKAQIIKWINAYA